MKKEELKETFEAALQEMRSYQQFFKESQTELLRQLQEVMQQNERKTPPFGDSGPSAGTRQFESQCDRFTSAGTTEWAIDLLGKLPVRSIRQRMLMHATLFEIADSRGEVRAAAFHGWAILEGLAGELIFPLVSSQSDSELDMAGWLMPLLEEFKKQQAVYFKQALHDPSNIYLKDYPAKVFRVTKNYVINKQWKNWMPSQMVFIPVQDIRVAENQIELHRRGDLIKAKVETKGLDLKELVNNSTGGVLVPIQSVIEHRLVDLEDCVWVMTKAPQLHFLSVVGNFTNYKMGFGNGYPLQLGEKTESPWLSSNASGPWWFRVERSTYPRGDEMVEVWKVKRGLKKEAGWDGVFIELKSKALWDLWYAKLGVTWLQDVVKNLLNGQHNFRPKEIKASALTETMYELRNQHAHNSVHPEQELSDIENLKEQFEAEWGQTIRYLCENWPEGRNCALRSNVELRNN